MWIYCFLSFIVFLILLIIYLFRHKKKKDTKKSFRFVVWGVGILTIALFAAACLLPADDGNLSKQESTEYYRISTAINNRKFDHILSDIDKLFPPDKDLNSIRQTNRFMLLRFVLRKNRWYQKGETTADGNVKKFWNYEWWCYKRYCGGTVEGT